MSNTEFDPKDVFVQALRFDITVDVLARHMVATWSSGHGVTRSLNNGLLVTQFPPTKHAPTLIPSFVCESFAIELYFKSIMYLEKIAVPQKHLLTILFDHLPQVWQGRISDAFDKQMQRAVNATSTAKTLAEIIAESSRAFEMWRYTYQGQPRCSYLSIVRFAAHDAIVAFKPDWADLRMDLCIPPKHPTPLIPAQVDELQWTLVVDNQQPDPHPPPSPDQPENQSE
ncbi:hypothetical protein ETAA8_69520 [Anatilimnocola aggregata]|uniref:Uncharacterized protein n=1 Tax=Anatilimnocola aggregata TaxID=2528021 RepID=A0A517YNI8_9BACT|nr:hypothetical protein [Anatilimnocola aggregata]QDU31792.1 hypothetical protein ETAA8_69520 [Anatilimnocola aggregata]